MAGGQFSGEPGAAMPLDQSFVDHHPNPPTASVPPQAMNPLWKTRLCSFFSSTGCRHGRLCTFAHGMQELRHAPDFTRTSICPDLLKSGRCDAVPGTCPYAHARDELQPAPGLMKTRMCDFHRKGTCIANSLCRFAHQVTELQGAASAFLESSGIRAGAAILEAEAVRARQASKEAPPTAYAQHLPQRPLPTPEAAQFPTKAGPQVPGQLNRSGMQPPQYQRLSDSYVGPDFPPATNLAAKVQRHCYLAAKHVSKDVSNLILCQGSTLTTSKNQADGFFTLQELQAKLSDTVTPCLDSQLAEDACAADLSQSTASSETEHLQKPKQLRRHEFAFLKEFESLDDSIVILQQWNSLPPESRARFLNQIRVLSMEQGASSGTTRHRERNRRKGRAVAGTVAEVLPVGPLRQPPLPRFSKRSETSVAVLASEASPFQAEQVAEADACTSEGRQEQKCGTAKKISELARLWKEISESTLGDGTIRAMSAQSGVLREAEADVDRLAARLKLLTQLFSDTLEVPEGSGFDSEPLMYTRL